VPEGGVERTRAGYEVEDVEYGKVYKWQPETLVVQCGCGEEASLTHLETACEECGAEHTGIVRENTSDLQPQGDEDLHPWRHSGEGEDDGALPY
jgi:hypothetical protein